MTPVRHGFLVRSVERLLGSDERLVAAAIMWRRHRLMVPYTAAVSVAFVFLAGAAGVQVWTTRFGLGAAGAVIAATATGLGATLAYDEVPQGTRARLQIEI